MNSHDYARQTKISADEWLLRVQKGGYRYTSTNWYRALRTLEAEAKQPAAPFLPVMFTAQDPLAVLNHRWPGRVALSADLAYRAAVIDAAPKLKDRGFSLYAWCDCKPGQTLPQEAIKLTADLGLAGWIGEMESAEAADNCLQAGATEVIGNASALTEAQRQEVIRRGIVFHMECYWGDGSPPPSQTSAMGIPARLAPGIYPACRPAADYVADMPALKIGGGALGGIYYAEGGDWTAFLP